jgi:UDP-N-acetylglucosamine acyltransferase
MATIHPTSIVDSGAELAQDVTIGPFCHVGPKVRIGSGTRLMGHVCIYGRTTVGEGNTIWPQVTLGGDPQDLKFQGEDSQLVIGDHNDIRENVTIHKGTENDQALTQVGDHNLIMAYVHLGHDCIVGNHVVIANSVQLAGHIRIEDYAAIGGATAIHHFVTVGKYAYVGGMTRIVADVPPFMIVEGNPSRVRGVNLIGLKRHGFDESAEGRLKNAWRLLYRTSYDGHSVGKMSDALAALTADYPDDACISMLVESIRRSGQGVHGRYREGLRRDNRYTNPVR